MFMILGILYLISAIRPDPINETDNATYILATVLYYKDIKGNIMVASGPISHVADAVIRHDISSHFTDANIKVIPVFDEPKAIPNSSKILNFIHEKYGNILVAVVPQRSSRNMIEDWWARLWHPDRISKSKPKATTTSYATPIKGNKPKGNATTSSTASISMASNTEASATKRITDEELIKEAFRDDTSDEFESGPKQFDQFLPKDIYYGIEKKCVNWSAACGLHSGNIKNVSAQYFREYRNPLDIVRPKFGPKME